MKSISTAATFLLFLFLSLSPKAQITTSSQWTWVKGDNTTNVSGVYGTQGVASAANKPGARGGNCASWTDASGNFWLFGGYDYSGSAYLNDLWKYSTTSNQWTWVNGASTTNQLGTYGTQGTAAASNRPGARYQSATWTDASGNFWLFGGYGLPASLGSGTNYINLNDLWKYSPVTNLWTWVNGSTTANQPGVYGTIGTPAAANTPGARYESVTWMDAAGNFWLFGGTSFSASGNDNFNDLWKYNPATNQWTWVNGANTVNQAGVYGTLGTAAAANRPGARNNSAAWTDAAGNFWLFGGTSGGSSSTFSNDLWKYSPLTNLWTWVNGANTPNQQSTYGALGTAAAANMPGARGVDRGSWTDASGNLWMFGGFGYAASSITGYLNDLWKYTSTTNQWTWINGANTTGQQGTYGTIGTAAATNQPGARAAGASWVDGGGNFWLFGGAGYGGGGGGFLNDLWKLSVGSALPVTLVGVKAYQQNNAIAVEWKVENETGIKQYDVEKSADGIRFTKVGVKAAAGNSAGTMNYSWIDMNVLPGNNYYRILTTSINGEVTYSGILKVTASKDRSDYVVYPNPVLNGNIQLQFINQVKGVYQVSIFNAAGQAVRITQIAHEAGSSTELIKLSNQMSKGNYTIEIVAPDKSKQAISVVY